MPETRAIQLPLSIDEWATLEAAFPLTEAKWVQMLAVLEAMKPALVAPPPPSTEPPLPPTALPVNGHPPSLAPDEIQER